MSFKRHSLSFSALLAGTLLVCLGLSHTDSYARDNDGRKPRIDLAFCIDTTGSMQNEIDAVKTKTKEIVAKLSGSKPTPDIRVGLVAYRDRGDVYVTKVFQFSDNIDQVVKDISGLKADGGGDEPEAVNQALHASVNDLNWSTDKKTVKLLFLIGDAGPHVYPGDYSWETESRNAIARGIQINTVACDGLNRNHESLEIFQKIARLADGKCEFLTYRQEVVDAGGKKSTLVSSAGKMYKVESSSADAWRAGADKLMARGAAVAMPEAGVGSFAEPASSDMRTLAKARAMSPSFSTRASVHAGAGCSVSRADSNLADIVLSATKEAARKKANIDFKD